MRKLLVGLAVLLLATQAQADMLDNYWEEGRPDDATLDFGAVVTYPIIEGDPECEFFTERDPLVLLPEGWSSGAPIVSVIEFYTALDLVTPTLVEVASFEVDPGGDLTQVEGLASDVQQWTQAFSGSGWETVTAGAGQYIDTVKVHHGGGGSEFRNIEVIPEPATLALLGLGGLGLLLRRKRR